MLELTRRVWRNHQCFIGIYTVETIAKLYSFGVITWQEPHEKKYLTKDFARTIQSP